MCKCWTKPRTWDKDLLILFLTQPSNPPRERTVCNDEIIAQCSNSKIKMWFINSIWNHIIKYKVIVSENCFAPLNIIWSYYILTISPKFLYALTVVWLYTRRMIILKLNIITTTNTYTYRSISSLFFVKLFSSFKKMFTNNEILTNFFLNILKVMIRFKVT